MPAPLAVHDLSVSFGPKVVLRDVSFEVERGDVFVIIGGSGSGKSTLLNCLIGLIEPASGDVLYGGESFTSAPPARRTEFLRRLGVLFQFGALFGGLTLAENVALPLEERTSLAPAEIRELAQLKLALVGLSGSEHLYPSQISGGMLKRAGIARAMALDPELLFLDEPSSGLDPVTARRMDELVLELRSSLDTTFVVVTHDLDSIFTIGTNAIYLDGERKTVAAHGSPREMLQRADDPQLREFLTRGRSLEART